MTALTFNTVTAVLEREFHVDAADIRPDTTFGELGLDAPARREFVAAVEDAFRLHLPRDSRVDPRDVDTELLALCRAIEKLAGDSTP